MPPAREADRASWRPFFEIFRTLGFLGAFAAFGSEVELLISGDFAEGRTVVSSPGYRESVQHSGTVRTFGVFVVFVAFGSAVEIFDSFELEAGAMLMASPGYRESVQHSGTRWPWLAP
jgi:hypothetical protein